MSAIAPSNKHERKIASSASSAALKRYKEKTRTTALAEVGGQFVGAVVDKQLQALPMLPRIPATVPVIGGTPVHGIVGGLVAAKHAIKPFKSALGAGVAGMGSAFMIRAI